MLYMVYIHFSQVFEIVLYDTLILQTTSVFMNLVHTPTFLCFLTLGYMLNNSALILLLLYMYVQLFGLDFIDEVIIQLLLRVLCTFVEQLLQILKVKQRILVLDSASISLCMVHVWNLG
jgi:hypothetical protein